MSVLMSEVGASKEREENLKEQLKEQDETTENLQRPLSEDSLLGEIHL